MLLLGRADFVRSGLAHGFADGRSGHAVLSRGDPVRDGLSRHITIFNKSSLKQIYSLQGCVGARSVGLLGLAESATLIRTGHGRGCSDIQITAITARSNDDNIMTDRYLNRPTRSARAKRTLRYTLASGVAG